MYFSASICNGISKSILSIPLPLCKFFFFKRVCKREMYTKYINFHQNHAYIFLFLFFTLIAFLNTALL